MKIKQESHDSWRLPSFRKAHSPLSPEHYHIHNNFQPGTFSEKVGLYLCANKASLQIDPINWDALLSELLNWSKGNAKSLPTLCDLTRQKFSQRIIPTHAGRSFNSRTSSMFNSSSNFFHYDFALPPDNEAHTMKTYVPIPQHLSLLSRLNQHDRLAGALGILPNHLIQLLRDIDAKGVPKITHDLRFATFWATYHIWTKRQTLNRTLQTWKESGHRE